ncbi:hypothetical protein [Clostridium beijerinckii]|uniref:hypothetical protein n=1 Tax=Clostridium beijerinckii TaxID=1520 RepID=UPI00157023A8|nr:hypothetical protein [Clostridium beijerinckii]
MDFYFITKIENFNKIFSLQFILPVKNYKETYNYKESRFDVNYEYITLYKSIPRINKEEFIIKIKLKDTENFIKVSEHIYLYPKNISIIDGKIIFFSEEIRNIVSTRTMLTSEVKKMKNYIKNSEVINKNYEFIDLNIGTENTINNIIINDELLKINLYDSILGGIYYSLYKNKSSILSNKTVKKEYIKYIMLNKYIKNLKENNCYFINIQNGFEKEKRVTILNIKRQLKFKGNGFLKFDSKGKFYIKPNDNFKCENDELIMFNIILNILYEDKDIKSAMIKIGEEIKFKITKAEYLDSFRKVYDIFINGKENYNINDIKSEILRSFIVSLFKHKRLSEIKELAERYDLKHSIYPYFFAGMLQKYSNISKVISDEIEHDLICKYIIENQVVDIFRIMDMRNKKEIYKEIQKFQVENNMYNLRVLNMKQKFKNIEMYSTNRNIINLKLKHGNESYLISFNENENEDFSKVLRNIELKKKSRVRYKSFKIKKLGNNKLSTIDEKNILNLINKKDY